VKRNVQLPTRNLQSFDYAQDKSAICNLFRSYQQSQRLSPADRGSFTSSIGEGWPVRLAGLEVAYLSLTSDRY